MIEDIFEHVAILNAHIAQKIVEEEGIDEYCTTPCDIAIISHDKKYVQRNYIGKMLHHLSEFEYMERRGDVFVLQEAWRRSLPAKVNSVKILREKEAYSLFLFQELLAKKFIEIVRNESQKINLSELVYYLDTVDGCDGLNSVRSKAIEELDLSVSPKKIFDYNHGLGYSAIQLSSLYSKSTIYSLQINAALRDAYAYTVNRFQRKNIKHAIEYPSEMMNQLMKDKVELICLFNPLGVEVREIGRFLDISKQISKEETKLLIQAPLIDDPKHSLIAEWLGVCVEGMGLYSTIENYKVLLSQHGFTVEKVEQKTNSIVAKYDP